MHDHNFCKNLTWKLHSNTKNVKVKEVVPMVLYRNNYVRIRVCGAFVNSSTVDDKAPIK